MFFESGVHSVLNEMDERNRSCAGLNVPLKRLHCSTKAVAKDQTLAQAEVLECSELKVFERNDQQLLCSLVWRE